MEIHHYTMQHGMDTPTLVEHLLKRKECGDETRSRAGGILSMRTMSHPIKVERGLKGVVCVVRTIREEGCVCVRTIREGGCVCVRTIREGGLLGEKKETHEVPIT